MCGILYIICWQQELCADDTFREDIISEIGSALADWIVDIGWKLLEMGEVLKYEHQVGFGYGKRFLSFEYILSIHEVTKPLLDCFVM